MIGACLRDVFTGRQGAPWRRGEPGAECLVKSQGPSLGEFSPPPQAADLTPQRTRSCFIPTLNRPPTPHSSWALERKARWVQKEGRSFWGEELPLYCSAPLSSPSNSWRELRFAAQIRY